MDNFPTQPVTLKVVYTQDWDAKKSCLARIDDFQAPICKMAGREFGSVDVASCLEALCEASPEVVSPESTDFAVYSLDIVEPDAPYVGHGRLSTLRYDSNGLRITGEVTTTVAPFRASTKALDVKLRLVPIPGTVQSQEQEKLRMETTTEQDQEVVEEEDDDDEGQQPVTIDDESKQAQAQVENAQSESSSSKRKRSESSQQFAHPSKVTKKGAGLQKGQAKKNNAPQPSQSQQQPQRRRRHPPFIPSYLASSPVALGNLSTDEDGDPNPTPPMSAISETDAAELNENNQQTSPPDLVHTSSRPNDDDDEFGEPATERVNMMEQEPEDQRGTVQAADMQQQQQSHQKVSKPEQDATPQSEETQKQQTQKRPRKHQQNPKKAKQERIKAGRQISVSAESVCKNCQTSNTSVWRRVVLEEDTTKEIHLLCNPCALYYGKHRTMRPARLWNYNHWHKRRSRNCKGKGSDEEDYSPESVTASSPGGVRNDDNEDDDDNISRNRMAMSSPGPNKRYEEYVESESSTSSSPATGDFVQNSSPPVSMVRQMPQQQQSNGNNSSARKSLSQPQARQTEAVAAAAVAQSRQAQSQRNGKPNQPAKKSTSQQLQNLHQPLYHQQHAHQSHYHRSMFSHSSHRQLDREDDGFDQEEPPSPSPSPREPTPRKAISASLTRRTASGSGSTNNNNNNNNNNDNGNDKENVPPSRHEYDNVGGALQPSYSEVRALFATPKQRTPTRMLSENSINCSPASNWLNKLINYQGKSDEHAGSLSPGDPLKHILYSRNVAGGSLSNHGFNGGSPTHSGSNMQFHDLMSDDQDLSGLEFM